MAGAPVTRAYGNSEKVRHQRLRPAMDETLGVPGPSHLGTRDSAKLNQPAPIKHER